MARKSNKLAKDSELPAQIINFETDVNPNLTHFGIIIRAVTAVIKDDSNFNERN